MRDYLSDDNGDLQFESGDLVTGDSTFDAIRKLMEINRGELHYAPVLGVGVKNYMHDTNPGDLMREVKQQVAADGGQVERITYKDGELEINANYED